MAKYKINIPIKKLIDGMLSPDYTYDNRSIELPEPGNGLIENPYFEGAKTKKKKKWSNIIIICIVVVIYLLPLFDPKSHNSC